MRAVASLRCMWTGGVGGVGAATGTLTSPTREIGTALSTLWLAAVARAAVCTFLTEVLAIDANATVAVEQLLADIGKLGFYDELGGGGVCIALPRGA